MSVKPCFFGHVVYSQVRKDMFDLIDGGGGRGVHRCANLAHVVIRRSLGREFVRECVLCQYELTLVITLGVVYRKPELGGPPYQ